MRERIKNIIQVNKFTFRLIFKNSAIFAFLNIFFEIATSFIPAITILLSKRIIDGLVVIYNDGSKDYIWGYILLLFGLYLLNSIIFQMQGNIEGVIDDRSKKNLTQIIADKLSKTELSYFENNKNLEAIDISYRSQYYIVRSHTYAIFILKRTITLISTLSVFFAYYPILALLYSITTLPGLYIQNKENKRMNEFSLDSISETRVKQYYYDMMTTSKYAKEMRLYNLFPTIKDKYIGTWKNILQKREKIFKEGFKAMNIAILFNIAGYIGLYVFLIYKTYIGELTLGGLAAFTAGVMTVSHSFNSIISTFDFYNSIFVRRILKLIEIFDWEEENAGPELSAITENTENFEITFDDVCFKYPNSDEYVLNHVSFTVKSCEKVALIGVNGAGKTTIVKLLLRMYRPDSGRILLNGVDIQKYDINEYRKNFSACFQIVNRYILTLAENVALSDISRVSNGEDIYSALEKSGLDGITDNLPKKLDTPLTRLFEEDGIELSVGQWQKIAISRAFFRNAKFVILDEPSSSLDPLAEEHIFRSFSKLCGEKSGIIISHRLSSVIMADKILFIEKGTIKEEGTHADLMKLNGSYAEMYRLQANKYI